MPDDHVFMIETDPEKGAEPWTVEALKQSAQLTEEAIKWKGWGEQAVTQRDILHKDMAEKPMQALYNVRRALGDDAQTARAWVVRAATDLVNENVEYEELDPAQKETMELRAQNARLQEALRRQTEEDEQAHVTAQEQEVFQQTYNAVSTAIDALGYEVTDDVVQLTLQRLDDLHLAGHTNITPSMATKMVLKELEEREKSQWQNFDPQKAPPETLEKFRQFEVERLKAGQKPSTPASSRSEPQQGRRRSRRAAGLSL